MLAQLLHMNRSLEDSKPAQNCKPWIRRHRILALLIPFVATLAFFTLFYAIQAAVTPEPYGDDPGAWHRFWEGFLFGAPFSFFGLIAFVWDWTRFGGRYWLAYPFYVIPAVLFLFSKRKRFLIPAYVVYCLLAAAAVFSGVCLSARLMP